MSTGSIQQYNHEKQRQMLCRLSEQQRRKRVEESLKILYGKSKSKEDAAA